MREFVPRTGWRVVADVAAIERCAASAPDGWRLAPDELLVWSDDAPIVDDEHAIVAVEHGFAAARLSAEQLAAIADAHIEWHLPGRGVAQGQLAGVPVKLRIAADGGAVLLVGRAVATELAERLGWT